MTRIPQGTRVFFMEPVGDRMAFGIILRSGKAEEWAYCGAFITIFR
jgi:hypothetical protein